MIRRKHTGPGATSIVILIVAISVVPLGDLAPSAWAASSQLMGATFPTGRDVTSAVWADTHAFIFGGRLCCSTMFDTILRYDPAADSLTTMGARLPTEREGTSAIWTGHDAYVFGGLNKSVGPLSQIVRYNASTDTVTVMSATLPTPRYGTAAAWDGRYAYVFGGVRPGPYNFDDVVRYDPIADVATVVATLPSGRASASAVWDPTPNPRNGCLHGCAYLLGGHNQTVGGPALPLDEVVAFNPSTNAVTVMGGELPTGRYASAAAFDGRFAYTFGGGSVVADHDKIYRYDPQSDTAVVANGTLPEKLHASSAVWDGSHVYLFSGHTPTGYTVHIARHTPDPFPVAVAEHLLASG